MSHFIVEAYTMASAKNYDNNVYKQNARLNIDCQNGCMVPKDRIELKREIDKILAHNNI